MLPRELVWAIDVLATLVPAVVWLFALRFIARWVNVAVGAGWIAAAAAVAGAACFYFFTSGGPRADYERGIWAKLGVTFASVALLAFRLAPLAADSERQVQRRTFWAVWVLCTLVPLAAWVGNKTIPAWLSERKNRVRSQYDQAISEGDGARARRVLDENQWLRREQEENRRVLESYDKVDDK
jgi:hypothetical protein